MTNAAANAMSWAKMVKSHLHQNPQSEIVIEITHDSSHDSSAVTAAHSSSYTYTHETKYKQEVDTIAKEVAIKFYEQCQTDMLGIARRSDLERLFNKTFPNSQKEFAVVLFAMAKGLKCVNVFNRGQELEWFPLSKTQLNRIKRAMRQLVPVPATGGWTAVGAVAAAIEAESIEAETEEQPIQKPIQNQIETIPAAAVAAVADAKQQPKPDFTSKSNDVEVPAFPDTPEPQPISTEDLIQEISRLRAEIKEVDFEIESLITFHREHLREMNRVKTINDKQLGTDLFDFHNSMKSRHEHVLDDLQTEISRKREKLAKLCDLLKQ